MPRKQNDTDGNNYSPVSDATNELTAPPSVWGISELQVFKVLNGNITGYTHFT